MPTIEMNMVIARPLNQLDKLAYRLYELCFSFDYKPLMFLFFNDTIYLLSMHYEHW